MVAEFYDDNGDYLGKTSYIYNYLNIDVSKLSEQEKYDDVKRKLSSLKMHGGTINTDDRGRINASKIYKVVLKAHNLAKPIIIYLEL
ncbi:hypothetical protein BU100_10785 [Staphylococcus xylosus]|uniref:hypothetical protein n=1 Tax=Staphylococcus xylosus TaxID=1288 RepID=UPI0009BDDB21|nr:hypothetical protein [Staphylococcus xylosus]ARD74171.1 hypothetical protein AWC37_03185 [Staphylococcus xylosus]MBF0811395.1 hypothetical protein [Staphylococcus xylosus]RIM92635.1 hypothetical protein BU100_10785 [Staphylococcus xylosus]TFV20518.1 hypothetical protein E4T72_09960 [Staphylococcus xylosus]